MLNQRDHRKEPAEPRRLYWYFLIGDLLACTLCGALTGSVCALLIGPAWSPPFAMFIGMFLGMLVALPLAFGFLPFFGAMEVMVPTMLTGMLAGMWVGMTAAGHPDSALEPMRSGAFIGLATLALTRMLDLLLGAARKR